MSQTTILFFQFVAIFILLTWALYLPFRAGQLYNGPVYCMAIGGYTAAYCVKTLGWPFLPSLVLAIIMAMAFGIVPALGFARTRGISTALGSIALIFIVQAVLRNLDFLGGPAGIRHLPEIGYLLPLSYLIVAIVGLVLSRLERSRTGRAMEAISVDPDLAATMGVAVRRVNIAALTCSSAIGGITGVLYAFTIGSIQPETFGFTLLLYVWSMLFIGGRFTMWGAIVAAPLMWGLPQLLPDAAAQYTNIFYGALLIAVIIGAPSGLVTRTMVDRVTRLLSRKAYGDTRRVSPVPRERTGPDS
jgi:branched-chain amino acid transport system permease protein